jgi:hypothetical protein
LAVERRAVVLRVVFRRAVVLRVVFRRAVVLFRVVAALRAVVLRRAVVLFLVVAALRAAVLRRAVVLFLVVAALRAAVLRRVVEVPAFRVVLLRVVAIGHPLSRVQGGRIDSRQRLGLGVDDNLCNFRMRPPNPFLDLARACMCISQWTIRIHPEREKRDETDICTNEPYTARLAFGDVANDATHRIHCCG